MTLRLWNRRDSTIEKLQHRKPKRPAAGRPFPSIAELLAHHAQATPDRHAILAPGRMPTSYRSLWSCAQAVLRALRNAGIGPSDRVAVDLSNGPEAAVASVAIGAAAVCVPLNPGLTSEEWKRSFSQTGVAALLTVADVKSRSRAAALEAGVTVLDLTIPARATAGVFALRAPRAEHASAAGFAAAADDAFLLLTSGTTSQPKAIPLTHAAVCQSAYNVGAAIELGAEDRLLSVLPLYHGHGLISGVLAALAAGSSVVCTPGFDPAAFFNWLTEFRPTWYTAVPTIHQAVLETAERQQQRAAHSSLRLIRSASSTLPNKVICGLEELFGVPVIDTFGMTEAATQIAANPMHRRKLGSVGIAAGAQIAILDEGGRKRPPGERGEIALRGPTITRGYDKNPAATREAFRGGWFRTGDLGYLDEDGYLFVVGRVKEVINRGGQKVAPGEVEEVLLAHPDVAEAAVFSVPHARLGSDVAAVIVLRDNAQARAQDPASDLTQDLTRNLRGFARKHLASFKVPGLIRIVPEIPRAAGGKIRRAELAAMFAASEATPRTDKRHAETAAGSDLEHQIAKIWADLLEIAHVGVDEDVFALGVDSIMVMQMILRLRERFGVDLTLEDIFDAPTVAALAAQIQKSEKLSAPKAPSLPRRQTSRTAAAAGRSRPVTQPVAIVQERMLRIERQLPGLPQFNLPFAYRLRGALDVAALKNSFAAVIGRHESLRTGFTWRNGKPVARVAPPNKVKLRLSFEDLTAGVTRNGRDKALLRRKAELTGEREALKAFDIGRPPLFRARLLRLGADDHVLLLTMHDVIIDGWSMGVMMQDLAKLYTGLVAGEPVRLAEPPLRFSEFALRQRASSRGSVAKREVAYWRERLRNVPPLFASSADDDVGSELIGRITQKPVHIANRLVADLHEMSSSRGATLFMALLAGFKTLLLLRTGRRDICVATLMANRSQSGAEHLVGPIANTVVIRTKMDADLSFDQALRRVREGVLESYARQQLPFDVLAARIMEEGVDPASLIQAYFVLQLAFHRPLKLGNIAVQPFGYRHGQYALPIGRTWLTMTVNATPSGIIGACSYKSELVAASHWVADYKAILAQAAAHPDRPLGRLADALQVRKIQSRKK